MVAVTLNVAVSDNCDPTLAVELIAINSSEPATGKGDNTSPDWELTGPLTANLRAESSKSADRVYTLTVRCTDASGNSSTTTVPVSVSSAKEKQTGKKSKTK